jgi:hypothetical protein
VKSIFLTVVLTVVASVSTACASAKEMSLAQLQALNNSARIAALENGAERAVTEAELASAIEEFKRGFHASFGPAALAAIGQDVELVAAGQGDMLGRIKRLETWLNRSRTKALVDGTDTGVFDTPPEVALPEPNYPASAFKEFAPAVRTSLEAAQRNYQAGRPALAEFWLREVLREFGYKRSFVLGWARRLNGIDAKFIGWMEETLLLAQPAP